MDQVAGWGLFITCIITNMVVFLLIDRWFEGDINGLRDDDTQFCVCHNAIHMDWADKHNSQLRYMA